MAHTNAHAQTNAKFGRDTNKNDSNMANIYAWCVPIQHKFKLVDLNVTCDPHRELEAYVRESLQGFPAQQPSDGNAKPKM